MKRLKNSNCSELDLSKYRKRNSKRPAIYIYLTPVAKN